MTSRPLHILYIAEFATGGSVESLLCLVGGLDKSAYRATVLFFTMPEEATCDRFSVAGASIRSLYPRSTGDWQPRGLKKLSLQAKIRRAFGRRIERCYETLKFALHFVRFRLPVYRAIRLVILEIAPDIIHLNNGLGSDTPGILAARRCRTPVVCHVRTLEKLTQINVALSRSVSKVLCISNAVREFTVAQGVDGTRCQVVHNAVDLSRFSAAATPLADIRNEFGWDSNDKVFTLAGRVVAWKGHEYFIRALAAVREQEGSARGLIVGTGDGTAKNDDFIKQLQDLVSKLGLDAVVLFAGHRTDVPGIMQSSDVVVCPSSEPEPFGRVIIESMAAGTAVIATDAGGATDIIQNEVNGLLVPRKDSRALGDAMIRLAKDLALRATLSIAARKDAQRLYTVEKHVHIICQQYAEAIEK